MIKDQWCKSSHSGQGNDCVELAARTDHIAIRDSKARATGTLAVSHKAWAAFLAAIRQDESEQ